MFIINNISGSTIGPFGLITQTNISSNTSYNVTDALEIDFLEDQYLYEALQSNSCTITAGSATFTSMSASAFLERRLNQVIKSVGNQPPFGAKTIVVNGISKKLFSRFTGIQQSLSSGDNTIDYTATYPWAKIIGIEVINGEALDSVDLKIYDTASGTYSGVPNYMLNQFSYKMNVSKDFYQKIAQFDADIYPGMILRFIYNSVSAKTIGINLLINEVK